MADHNIVDNFLSNEELDKIQKFIISNEMPWFWDNDPAPFSHLFYLDRIVSEQFNKISYFLESNKIDSRSMIKIKASLYSRTDKIVHYNDSIDYQYSHNGALFMVDSSDGFTVIDGEEIETIENRMIFFDPSISHHETTCTNKPFRPIIKFNYF